MEGHIEGVVVECGEAETRRMKVVTDSALKDSAEMYVLLSGSIQPEIGQLMNKSIELNTFNKERELYVATVAEYTEKVKDKYQEQVQVRSLSLWKVMFMLMSYSRYAKTIIALFADECEFHHFGLKRLGL